MPGRNCRRMDNHRYGPRGKIINNPTDGSSRLARRANRLPAFTDLGTTDFFRIINGGQETVRLRELPSWLKFNNPNAPGVRREAEKELRK